MSVKRSRVVSFDFHASAQKEPLGSRGRELFGAHHAAWWKFVEAGQRGLSDDLFHTGCRYAEYWEKQFKRIDGILQGLLASDCLPDHLRTSAIRRRYGARRDARLLSESEADLIAQFRMLSAQQRHTVRTVVAWARRDALAAGQRP